MNTYHTSYCRPLDLAIDAEGRALHFRGLPKGGAFDRYAVQLVSSDGREATSADLRRLGENSLSTGNLPDGEYALEVYTQISGSGRFRSFLQEKDALVRITDGCPSFTEPWCLRSNLSILERISRSPETLRALLRNEPDYPCAHPEIQRIAAVIISGITDTYGKLLAVHDWVAENVFYDRDSLCVVNDTLAAAHRSTIDVLRTRRAVCQGYSDLAVAFLRACGIPAISLGCFALGQGTQGGWESPENHLNRPNHAFTAALMGNRYVLMDITWDSDNIYSEGRYQYQTGCGRSRKYFDISPMLLSASHRLIERG